MSVYATIDLNSLMSKLSNKELYDFMLETFHDSVPDESHVSLITEMFKVMFDTDQKEAFVAMLKDMGEYSSDLAIKEYFESIPSKRLKYYETIIKDLQEN